jgi:hypothetical protein
VPQGSIPNWGKVTHLTSKSRATDANKVCLPETGEKCRSCRPTKTTKLGGTIDIVVILLLQ